MGLFPTPSSIPRDRKERSDEMAQQSSSVSNDVATSDIGACQVYHTLDGALIHAGAEEFFDLKRYEENVSTAGIRASLFHDLLHVDCC